MKRTSSHANPVVRAPQKQKQTGGEPEGSSWALYVFMAMLLAALIYFLILPFTS